MYPSSISLRTADTTHATLQVASAAHNPGALPPTSSSSRAGRSWPICVAAPRRARADHPGAARRRDPAATHDESGSLHALGTYLDGSVTLCSITRRPQTDESPDGWDVLSAPGRKRETSPASSGPHQLADFDRVPDGPALAGLIGADGESHADTSLLHRYVEGALQPERHHRPCTV